MPIDVTCPECSGRFRVPDAVGGKKIACNKCGGTIPVPLSGAVDPSKDVPRAAVTPKRNVRSKPAASQPRPEKKSPPRKPAKKKAQRSQPARRRKSKPRKPASSGRRRSRSREEFDDYPSSGDDLFAYGEADLYGAQRSRSTTGAAGREKWVRIALLIIAVGLCIRTASFASEFIVRVIVTAGRTTSVDLILGLLKASIWLHLAAFVTMIAGYIFSVMAPDRSGSQLWSIASLVMGLMGVVLFVILKVLPLTEDAAGNQIAAALALISPAGGMSSMPSGIGFGTATLWDLVFRNWVLAAVYLSPILLSLLFVKCYFQAAKKSTVQQVATMCRIGIAFLVAHAMVILFQGLLVVLLVEVIIPGAIESANEAMQQFRENGGTPPTPSPPSKLWYYMVRGCDWLAAILYLGFLILALRIYFAAWSRVGR